ncbi:MAG TPA: hypothetical protein PLD88_07305 [Candidatus Berkiella sp.]|nr:hypothetical protein [Candidatus Berkiella sp.]
MRQLTLSESSMVSGAESHDVMIIDPVAAAQTFFYLISVTDQNSFRYGSVVTGMTVGAIGGGFVGYAAAAGAGVAAGVAASVAGVGLGAVAGGLVCKGAASFMVTSYNWIMA